MTRIVVTEAEGRQLRGLAGPVELCNEAGKVLGRFHPASTPSQDEEVDPPIIREGVERRSESQEKT